MLLNNAESADLLKTRAMLVSKTVNTLHHCLLFTKGGFLSESAIRFSNLQISKKEIFQKTILNLKFKIPAHNSIMLWAGILNFKVRIAFLK